MDTQPDDQMTSGDDGGGKPADGASDASVDQIAADIGETREDLTDTVREIGDRLEPAHLVRQARETARGATIGKAEMMSIGAQETWHDVRTGNAGGIMDMVRENPVPAGMVGLGLALLFLNRGSQKRMDRDRTTWVPSGATGRYALRRDADWYSRGSAQPSPADRMGAMASDARDSMGGKAQQMADSVGQMADSMSQTAGRAGQTAGQMAEDLPQQAGAMVDSGTSQARRMIDENPLGAGVIALAAGAVLGMLLPPTPFERETVGPVRDQVVEQVGAAAEGTIDAARSAARRADGSSQSDGSSHAGGSGGSAS